MKQIQNKKQTGIALLEIIVVMGIFATLFGFVTTSLFNARNKTSINTTIQTVVANIQQQQIKAMSLDTEGRAATDTYGIYFEQNRYILFHGSSYSPADTSNFTVEVEDGMVFSSISLPGSSIVFQKRSGEVIGFDSNLSTLTVKNTNTNEQKTLQINRLGVIKEIN